MFNRAKWVEYAGTMKSQKIAISVAVILLVVSLAFILRNFQISGGQINPAEPADSSPTAVAVAENNSAQTTDSENKILLYSVDIYYNSGDLSEQGIKILEGDVPDQRLEKFIDPSEAYAAKIISQNGDVLYLSKFEMGIFAFDLGQLDETFVTILVPYFAEGKTIEIYNPQGELKLSVDISRFSRPESAKGGRKAVQEIRLTFDEKDISGAEVKDLSGNNNNGIIYIQGESGDACEAGKRLINGKFGEAVFFEGIGDFVAVNDSLVADENGGTVSAWINPFSGEGVELQAIIKKQSADSGLYSLDFVNQKRQVKFSVDSGNGRTGLLISKTEIPLGNWTLVTASWDAKKMRLYINGNLENETVFKGYAAKQGLLFIGGSPSSAGFNGGIDDVRVYNAALSQQDALELFGEQGKSKGVTAIYGPEGRIHLWSFEEDSGNAAIDSINNNNGTSSDIKRVKGKIGKAASFNSSYVSVASPLVVPDQNQLSIDAWIYLPQNISSSQTILQILGPKAMSGSPPNAAIIVNSTGLGLISYGSNQTQNTSVSLGFYTFKEGEYQNISGSWSHIAAVFERDGSSSTGSLYLDGGIKARMEHMEWPGDLNASYLIIGGSSLSGLGTFTGFIDEVSVYNRSLGIAEVERLSRRAVVPEDHAPLSVSDFLAKKESYICKSVTLEGLIESKDKCEECLDEGSQCVCKNKVLELADIQDENNTVSVNFYKDDQLYRNLEENSKVLIGIRNLAGSEQVAYNFLEQPH